MAVSALLSLCDDGDAKTRTTPRATVSRQRLPFHRQSSVGTGNSATQRDGAGPESPVVGRPDLSGVGIGKADWSAPRLGAKRGAGHHALQGEGGTTLLGRKTPALHDQADASHPCSALQENFGSGDQLCVRRLLHVDLPVSFRTPIHPSRPIFTIGGVGGGHMGRVAHLPAHSAALRSSLFGATCVRRRQLTEGTRSRGRGPEDFPGMPSSHAEQMEQRTYRPRWCCTWSSRDRLSGDPTTRCSLRGRRNALRQRHCRRSRQPAARKTAHSPRPWCRGCS